MRPRVLVTARAFQESGGEARQRLEEAGFEVVDAAECGPHRAASLVPLLAGFEAVVAATDEYTAEVFAALPALRVVSRWGIGLDSVDLDAAARAGVIVTNTPDTTTEAVADYAWALLLAVARRIAEGEALMRSGGWGELPGRLIHGKTLGLVGLGRIARAVARRASGFSMEILAHDPYVDPAEAPAGVCLSELPELLERSDVVSLHAAVTPQTRGMIGAAELARMKPTALLINTGRGALIDESALLTALRDGQIGGAALDVYATEPLPADHPLRSAPKCLLTPHNAFNAIEAARATSARAADSIREIWRGLRPPCVANPAVWDSPSLRACFGEGESDA